MASVGGRRAALFLMALLFTSWRGGGACPNFGTTLSEMKQGIDCNSAAGCTMNAPVLTAFAFNDPAVSEDYHICSQIRLG